jgi:hypothetical protein
MTLKLVSDSQIRDKDIDTLKRFIRYKLGGYRVAINEIPAGHQFFRGVLCEDRPSTIDRISYPPVERVTRLGRVNRPGTPMFYCSVAAAPVFYELRAKKGDLVALSRWEVVEPLWMHHLGYHQDALRRMGVADLTMRSRLTNPIPNETKENARLRARRTFQSNFAALSILMSYATLTERNADGGDTRYRYLRSRRNRSAAAGAADGVRAQRDNVYRGPRRRTAWAGASSVKSFRLMMASSSLMITWARAGSMSHCCAASATTPFLCQPGKRRS